MIPDAELLLLAALRAAEPGLQAGTKLPPGTRAPDGFVRVQRIGGTLLGHVRDLPRLDVTVFGEDAFERMALANRLRAACRALQGTSVAGVQVYSWREELGARPFPDPLDPSRDVTLFTIELGLRAG